VNAQVSAAAAAPPQSARRRNALTPANNRAVDTALRLARHGIPVFPCHPGTDPGDPNDPCSKKPLTKHGFKDARTDEGQIRRWWARWPNALVGVPTGSASGLLVIDIDPAGVDFLLEHDELDAGRRHSTRRGSHFLFRAPPDVRIRCSAGKLADGVDVRGEAGYIIWWPATGLAASGPNIDELPAVPTRLLELLSTDALRTTSQLPSQGSHGSTATLDGLRRLEVALTKRDADCGYEEWVRIGMALHHESGGSEEGFRIWDEWSKRGTKKYQGADDLRTHWNSFSSVPGKNVVTAGTILRGDTASADEFLAREPDASGRRFVAIPDHQFVERAPLSWHVKGVLPRAELAVLYGPSGSGKSFLAFDMVAAIATGAQWHGRRTARGRVVYVVAEGATGFLNRLKAYTKTRSGCFPGIRIIADAPNLLGETDYLSLASEIDATGGADVIVIDTLAVCSPGADENAAKDMGRVIEHCKQLHKTTGATVLLIHHSGKDESKGARGWSGLRAAADTEIEVSRNADHRTAAVTKMKDGEDGAEFAFKLVPVDIGVDADGDPVTSCVVEPLPDLPSNNRKQPRPGTVERTLLDSIRDDPSADERVSVPGAIEAAMPLLRQPTGRDTRRQHLIRALRALASKGFITVEGNACRVL
jgi:AAA domain-containing protein/bifunctional DNA primase/polymerase-like protein/primase-like protein